MRRWAWRWTVGQARCDVEREPTASPTAARTRMWPALSLKPLVGGMLLALVGMNLSTVRPTRSIDSSFRVGLTEAVLERMQFGVDIVWPYGPLGFLGGPTLISRGLLAVAILYQFVALAVLFTTLVFHLGRLGLGRVWSVVALAPVGTGHQPHRQHRAGGRLPDGGPRVGRALAGAAEPAVADGVVGVDDRGGRCRRPGARQVRTRGSWPAQSWPCSRSPRISDCDGWRSPSPR